MCKCKNCKKRDKAIAYLMAELRSRVNIAVIAADIAPTRSSKKKVVDIIMQQHVDKVNDLLRG